jgi:hypothetical protein
MCLDGHLYQCIYLTQMDMDQQRYYVYTMLRRRTLSVIVLLLALWYRNRDGRKNRGRGRKYGPLVERDLYRTNVLIRLINTSDTTCIKQLRMSRSVFYKLCNRLRQKELLIDTFHVSVEEQVAMFLYMVGQHHTNSSVGFWFWRSSETVSRYFNIVLRAIGELARDLIYIRSTDTHTKITSSPNRFYPYFEVTIRLEIFVFIIQDRRSPRLTYTTLFCIRRDV